MLESIDRYFTTLIIIFIVVALGEQILMMTWTSFYFRYSIRLFKKSYHIPKSLNITERIPELETKLQRTRFRSAIVFKELAPDEIGYRHQLSSRNPLSGLMLVDQVRGQLTIRGNLYWTYFLLLINVVFLLTIGDTFFALIFLTMTMIASGLQYYNHTQIAHIISETLGTGSLVD